MVVGEIPVRVALAGELCVHAQAPQGKEKRRHQFVYFNTVDFNLGVTDRPAGRNSRSVKISMGTASLVSSGESIPVVLPAEVGQPKLGHIQLEGDRPSDLFHYFSSHPEILSAM